MFVKLTLDQENELKKAHEKYEKYFRDTRIDIVRTRMRGVIAEQKKKIKKK